MSDDKTMPYGIALPAGVSASDVVCAGMTVDTPVGQTRYHRGPICAACGEPTWSWDKSQGGGRFTIGSDCTTVGMAITSNEIGGTVTNPGTHYHNACVPR